MIKILYAPIFVRLYKGLPPLLKEEIKEKIEIFKDKNNHIQLKVHKLKGDLKNTYSFSVNYQIRIVFEYEDKNTVNLLYVGDHDKLYS
ncbi:MAG: type II toxin-antitoxin system RelE/ParE family toxin [Candidatus Taylorbacteria bacterium]|nr:type II toxin-antitoxin system RelE/ParE family toxin [Candidatus Taylorbacteria bacterium]